MFGRGVGDLILLKMRVMVDSPLEKYILLGIHLCFGSGTGYLMKRLRHQVSVTGSIISRFSK